MAGLRAPLRTASTPTILQRSAITVACWHDLPHEVRANLAGCATLLTGLRALSFAQLAGVPESELSNLRHPLSDHFIAANGCPEIKSRSAHEHAVLAARADDLMLAAADPLEFSRALDALNAELAGPALRRKEGEHAVIHGRGVSIRFIASAAVSAQLDCIRQVLAEQAEPDRVVFRAGIVLAMLTNAHPYRDGNGRVGRVLFNLALRQGGMPPTCYVALSEISNRSRGGYEIRLRQTETQAHWEPYLLYLCDVIRLQATWSGPRQ